jgi:hypothetical protein
MNRVGFVFLLVILQTAPDFSGTWKLDSKTSQIAPASSFAGLIRNGAPETLHVTQPANGTLIVESQINESHSRIYRPGGKTTTPVGPTGSIAMSSRWEGRSLIAEGSQDSTNGGSVATREVFTLSADGKILTIELTADKTVSTLVYTRSAAVEPCQKWPTPCKPGTP